MTPDLLIKNALIINDNQRFTGYVAIIGERIAAVGRGTYTGPIPKSEIDADGKALIPGVIDDQVHFRDPGLTEKADIHTESIAAVAGGVTSFMEMPNTKPQTTTIELLGQKMEIAAEKSVANYAFYLGATNDNLDQIRKVDPKTVCGVKVFMGASTGNMLVDNIKALEGIFAESPVLIATHCEEESIIRHNMELMRARYGDNIPVEAHPFIRSVEACYASTEKAVGLADKYNSRLHVLHLSTAAELSLFESKPLSEKRITNEVCVHHLWFTADDYATRGNRIKWNPAVKWQADRDALRQGLISGKIDVVATDHAPHTKAEKAKPYLEAPSGGPLVQHSLTVMLEMAAQGVWTPEFVVEKMCHAPARLFGVVDRGYIAEGYYADMVLVDLNSPWRVSAENILYKCGWSPLEGDEFSARVTNTIVNGHMVYADGVVDAKYRGKPLVFSK